MPFEPLVGTLHIALGKRLPGLPSDWSAPVRTYCWLKGFRYTFLRLFNWASPIIGLIYMNGSTEPFSGVTEIRPQGRWDQVTPTVNKKTRSDEEITCCGEYAL